MDHRNLLVEAIVSGEKGYYECPVQLRLYGTNHPVAREDLVARMKNDGLPACTWKDVKTQQRDQERRQKEEEQRRRKEKQQRQKAEQQRQRIATQAAKQAKKNGNAVVTINDVPQQETGMGEFAGGSTQGFGSGPSLADIMSASERFNPRNAEQYVEEFGSKENDLVSWSTYAIVFV
jgi:SWI/SNF-related matrix-associated actin-dependent regulator of chromatin subfamily A3